MEVASKKNILSSLVVLIQAQTQSLPLVDQKDIVTIRGKDLLKEMNLMVEW